MRLIIRRIALYVITAIVAITINFFLPRLMPGNPALAVLGKAQSAESPRAVAALEVQYGVQTPTGTWGQYTRYWDHLLHGNLGTSLNAYPASVGSLIRADLPWTIGLCPAASGGGSRSPGRWPSGPGCCWLTNRSPCSTSPSGARYLADVTAVMYAGQVVESGPATPLTDEPTHPYTQLLLSAAPDPDRPAPLSLAGRGVPSNLIRPPSGCRFHPRCPHAMTVCVQAAPLAFALGGEHSSACWLHACNFTAAQSRPLQGRGRGGPGDEPPHAIGEKQ